MVVTSDTEAAISFVEALYDVGAEEPQPPSSRMIQSTLRFSLLSVFNSIFNVAMEFPREQKRLLMLHENRLSSSAVETSRRINEAWGEGTVGRSAFFDRFNGFKDGNGDLTQKQEAGRQQELDRRPVLNATER
ncbi:hypothetical protein KIN20_010776 [Parelaphostrongylus tenuis]|uniref:Mos1 transposase HTH domain-containing protein n=1 Tax=Parelaphostrongylus tenuis TaxID=148309 RepID=A0AAD5MZD6_PARTN|nr:hypothetical protein KIN20_010776 [Parelaphostrongylus tenuis]